MSVGLQCKNEAHGKQSESGKRGGEGVGCAAAREGGPSSWIEIHCEEEKGERESDAHGWRRSCCKREGGKKLVFRNMVRQFTLDLWKKMGITA